MKNQNRPISSHNILKLTIIYILLSIVCTSCTMFQATPTPVKKPTQPQIVEPVIQQQVEQSPYASIEQKGDNEIKAGNYRSGLNIYNNLLTKYSGEDKTRLLEKTEALLSIMKNSDLEVVLNSKKSQIPESMLLYQIGVNYFKKQKDNQKAKEVLSKFISSYPDDPRVLEVELILKEIEKSSFAKNIIGCMLPLSGKYQTFGKQALRGIQMALQDAKALYSDQEIDFIIKDTESNDAKAETVVQELSQTNIAAIAGPMVTSEAAAKEAQKYQIPMICMTQKSEVTDIGDYIFSNFITPEMQIKGLVSHARGVLGIEKFAVLAPNDKYGQRFMSLYRQAVAEAGGEIVVAEVYRDNQTDFSEIIKKIAAFQPQTADEESQRTNANNSSDSKPPEINGNTESNGIANTTSDLLPKIAIFIPDSPSKAATILPQLLYYNVKEAYLLGTNIWHNNALLKIPSEHIKNVVITDGYFAQSRKPESARFAEAFKTVYGEYPGFIEAVAYDTALILIKTAMDKSTNSRLDIKNILAGNMIYSGVTGETMFETNGNAQKELFFLTIENSAFVEIERH
ncbi:MAG: penicillin-binding protein activator [Desulfamplus sp.]|nr:penicillin-binding protein activator [Desulfamplus sp.]